MCIAIYHPHDAPLLSKEVLKRCAENNDDGMGIMWASPNGTIQMYKTLEDFESFYAVVASVQLLKYPFVLHFRLTTHGGTNIENTHPFFIPNTAGEWAMCHNGVISAMPTAAGKSDTRFFADALGELKPGWLENPAAVAMVEDTLGKGNKVVMMNNKGDVVILNENAGVWDDGVWYSNTGYRTSRWNWKSWQHDDDYSSYDWRSDPRYGRHSGSTAASGAAPSCRVVGTPSELPKSLKLVDDDEDDPYTPMTSDDNPGRLTEEGQPACLYDIGMEGFLCYDCAKKLAATGINGTMDKPLHLLEEVYDAECAYCGIVMNDSAIEEFYVKFYKDDQDAARDSEDEHLSVEQKRAIERIMEGESAKRADSYNMAELVEMYDEASSLRAD